MKLKFEESTTYFPTVIIAPNDSFEFPNATIKVLFFQYDEDGMMEYKPTISADVSFNDFLEPSEADNWGNCLKHAALIAQGGIPNYIEAEFKNEVVTAYLRIKEIREANGI